MTRAKRPNGAGNITPNGYFTRAVDGVLKLEHIRVAERALGKPLPSGAIVHHMDEDRLNNAPSNLVVCPNGAYHKLIHQRLNAMKACGHAHWRKCRFCKEHDAPANLLITKTTVHHRACWNAYMRQRNKQRSSK